MRGITAVAGAVALASVALAGCGRAGVADASGQVPVVEEQAGEGRLLSGAEAQGFIAAHAEAYPLPAGHRYEIDTEALDSEAGLRATMAFQQFCAWLVDEPAPRAGRLADIASQDELRDVSRLLHAVAAEADDRASELVGRFTAANC